MFTRQRSVEAGFGRVTRSDGCDVPVEACHSVEFVPVAHARRIEASTQNSDRFVVRRKRNRKRMAVFSAVGEGEARRV